MRGEVEVVSFGGCGDWDCELWMGSGLGWGGGSEGRSGRCRVVVKGVDVVRVAWLRDGVGVA